MNIWIAKDGAHWTPHALEAIPRPVSFPRFATYPNELPTARAQRWRQTFKELASKQHDYVLAVAAWALHDAKGVPSLETILRGHADEIAAHQDLDYFIYRAVDCPLELTLNYKFRGSTKVHRLTFSLLSPSQQEQ